MSSAPKGDRRLRGSSLILRFLFHRPKPSAGTGSWRDDRPTILQVIPNMEYGGVQRLVENIATGPLSDRFRFEVLCLTHSGQIGDSLSERGVPVHVAGLSGWKSLADWRRLADYASTLEPDLVHSHLLPGDTAAHVGFRGRAPIISTVHNTDPNFSWFVRLVERHVLRDVPVFAVSDVVSLAKSYLGPRGMLPPVVQSPPAVARAASPAPLFIDDAPVRLAIIGRLHKQKRVDIFIRAAAELERRFPGRFSFRVVGDGRECKALRDLAASLDVAEQVEFRDAVADVAKELDESDIVLLLSDYEGLGLSVLETLARGRIPLVRRVAGADEALPSSLDQCFIESADPTDVAGKVLEICEKRAVFEKLVRIGQAWVAERPNYATVMGRVYDGALSRHAEGKKRILNLITRLIVGGAQETAATSVARITPERYETHLWTGPQTGPEGSMLDVARRDGVIAGVVPNLVREINPWRDLVALIQLTRLFRKERFDIVHTHSSKAGILGRLAARFAGVPRIVHTVHGWGFHEHMHPARRTFYTRLERSIAKWTDVLISVSNRTTKEGLASDIGRPEQYELIRSGIPLSQFYPDETERAETRLALGISDDEIVVGSVGRLSPQKNPIDFIRVAERLISDHERVRFIYVGDGPLRGEIESAAEQAGLNKRLQLLGIRDDVPSLLRAMDLFVLTSLWEGLPRAVLQALATGLPVIAYDTAGIREAVVEGRNGHLVDPGDVDGMVEKLGPLVGDASLRHDMSSRAVGTFDQSFSEDAMIRGLEDLYDSLTR